MIDRSKLKPHEIKALDDHYREYGVGDTTAHRVAHWHKLHNNQIFVSVETDEAWVAALEFTYLIDLFPEEHPSC